MLATIRNDTWNVLNMQHTIQFMDQNKQHLIELDKGRYKQRYKPV